MSDTLTKARLVEALYARVGLTKRESAEIVDALLDAMSESLVEGDKLKISGFGNFLVRQKAARRGRNPQTSEEIEIAPRRVVTFKPSQVLRAALNEHM